MFIEGQEDDKKPGKPEDGKLQVVIEDDTPPEDRGRKPLDQSSKANEDDSLDDEAASYTKGVKKRINELTHRAHDQRRRAEAAERQAEEAARIANAALQRSRQLEAQLMNGEAAFAGTTLEREELALANAQDKYQAAFDAGDAKAMAEATAAVSAAAQRLENAKQWKARAANNLQQTALQNKDDDVDSQQRDARSQPQPRQSQPEIEQPDDVALAWAEKNPWFGKDRKMTSMVYGVHEELTFDEGIDPKANAQEYYARIDKEMRLRFPEYQWDDADNDTGNPASKSDDPPKPKAKPASIVAPVSRSTTGAGRTVKLTKSEVALAERMGLTIEQYAEEKMKLNAGA